MDDEDFLAAVEADNTNAPVEDPKEPDVLELTEPAPPEPAEPVVPAQEPEAPQPQPEPQHAPLAALLDERDKRKAAEDRLRQYEQAIAQQQPQPVPDMFENPEEYNAYISSQVDQARYQDRLFMSERLAKVEHGAEAFTKAKEWGLAKCDTDPFFNAKVRQSQDPYGTVMEEWKRDQAASIPTDEFAQFQAWKQAQTQLQQQGGQPPPPNVASAIPPRSLASAPSAGNILTEPIQSQGEIIVEVFPK